METNILILDDEIETAELVGVYLKNEGFHVHIFYSAHDAISCIQRTKVDLAILDIMLPYVDGFTICRKIRENYNFPVIMLTAKEKEVDTIRGLTLGADDYVTKPFRPLELVARVKAQLRRYTKYDSQKYLKKQNTIEINDLVLNNDKHECIQDGKRICLTPTEFSILWFLCSNCGRVVSLEELFHKVWGEKYYTSCNNTLMVHIRHIREKLHESTENPRYIKTVWGVGYKVDK